jgi:hypothetical protein
MDMKVTKDLKPSKAEQWWRGAGFRQMERITGFRQFELTRKTTTGHLPVPAIITGTALAVRRKPAFGKNITGN